MTELEVAMASLTLDELREAGEYIESLRKHFRLSPTIEYGHVAATEGPSVVLDGLILAFMREVATRYGASEWYLGMPTDGHEGKGLLNLLIERMALNPDRQLKKPGTATGEPLTRLCGSCQVRYPLSEDHWERVSDHILSATCRGCLAGLRAKREPFPDAGEAFA